MTSLDLAARGTRLLAVLVRVRQLHADFPGHAGRPGKVGGSLPGGQSVGSVSDDSGGGRVFDGSPVPVETVLSKQAAGAIGERVAQLWLEQQYGGAATPANVAKNNFPVDVVHGGTVIEVKTGLVSNRRDAQKWRLTIGQPGTAETAWLKTASAADKAAWNANKVKAIEARKAQIIRDMSQALGTSVTGKTVGVILNPDTRRADIYEFEGFHPVIRWNSPTAKGAYQGTVAYD